MRMQLIKWSLILAVMASLGSCGLLRKSSTTPYSDSQVASDSTELSFRELEETEMNFMFSYYEQDGNNSAVTGGIGTEQLTDFTPKVVINVPINETTQLNIDGGFDRYTSASTDQIDSYTSSASSQDTRIHGNVGITKTLKDKGVTYSLKGGGSREYDYNSLQVGGSFSKTSKDGNREFGISGQVFFDTWETFYPEELRGKGELVPTKNRRSYNLALSYSQVINKRLQVSLMAEAVQQTGLLSTPFHRVYFAGESLPRLETLPANRTKIPVGLRLNYYVADFLLIRSYYRFYWDDWGVTAHTANIELPIKLNRFFSVYPFYRYHTQTAADYFQPFEGHSADATFYTADYDLAALSSHQYGAGIRFSPVEGITRIKRPFKKGTFLLRSVDLRYAHYTRSTGLAANIVSLGMNFTY